MSVITQTGSLRETPVTNAGEMEKTIRRMGIIPFFTNPIPAYSIEEMTPKELWFNEDSLGPWDWKIECIQSGDIVYGKYLWGGKSAFATVEWYAELMNWRRSLPKYTPVGPQASVLAFVQSKGSATIRDIRTLLDVKKSVADGIVTRLQQQTRLITGDIRRVYRGPDLRYSGWQTATFCTPEALFGDGAESAPALAASTGAAASLAATFGAASPFAETESPLDTGHSPAESFERLAAHIRSIAPGVSDPQIAKMLG